MEIKHILRTERNENDCWTLALSYALDTTYEKVRKNMKPFINKDGSLIAAFSVGALLNAGYKEIDFSEEVLTVEGTIKLIDSNNNHLIIYIDDHVFYVENKVIHDSSEDTEDLLKRNVNSIMYKEKKL